MAIVIGTAFLAATLSLLGTATRGVQDAVAAGLSDVDLVLTGAEENSLSLHDREAAAAIPGVGRVAGQAQVYLQVGPEILVGATSPGLGSVLVEGRFPQATGEIAVTRAARSAGLDLDEALTLSGFAPPDDADPPTADVEVVGVIDPGPGSRLNMRPGFLGTDAMLRQVDPNLSYTALHVYLEDGADPAQVREALVDAVPGAVPFTGQERAQAAVQEMAGGADVMTALAVGFGAVALATAGIVIANTFTITLAQRQRELALLRCVGASTAQVRRQVLLEALILGVIASVAGLVLGLAAAAVLLLIAQRIGVDAIPGGTALAITPLALILPLVCGVLVTVLAGLWPAVRATRVAPLEAMRPSEQPPAHRLGPRRLIVGAAIFVIGLALMVLGAVARDLSLGIVGGLVSFTGVVIAAVVLIPLLVRALGVAVRSAGVPGRLAVDNAVRNPGRAAATGTALLVGVTLITMTSVGAATGERTVMEQIDAAYAVDLVATAPEALTSPADPPRLEQLAPALTNAIGSVEGIAGARAVPSVIMGMGQWADPILTIGLDAEKSDVIRSADQLASLEPGTLGLGNVTQAIYGIRVGDQITMQGTGGTRELRVVEFGLGSGVVALNTEDLTALNAGQAPHSVLLLRLTDGVNPAQVLDDLREVGQPSGVTFEGPAAERGSIVQLLDILVLLATALLAVTVIIAVVGIANTLSLSVIERRREHALLRAMGLTTKQLRLMLLTEGTLLAAVSSLIGVALGVLYGRLGAQTILPDDIDVRLAIPALRISLIIATAIAAGLLASVLPARRATHVTPAQGLAQD